MSLTTEISAAVEEMVSDDTTAFVYDGDTYNGRVSFGPTFSLPMRDAGYESGYAASLVVTLDELDGATPATNELVTIAGVNYRIADIGKSAAFWNLKLVKDN
jgi:hypothetical protein